ncbi:MAG TPA: hypothetical protein VJ575_04265 [Pseudogulbenkiania sp.]|nr:hypothetical protein [Pseudogulbenkiania sp.]
MVLLAVVLSVMVAGLGVLGLVAPGRLLTLMRIFQRPGGLYWAAGIRLLLGGALVLASAATRFPVLLWWLGWFIVVSGLVTPLFGQARLARLLDWWAAQRALFMRLWTLLALAIGLELVYALLV